MKGFSFPKWLVIAVAMAGSIAAAAGPKGPPTSAEFPDHEDVLSVSSRPDGYKMRRTWRNARISDCQLLEDRTPETYRCRYEYNIILSDAKQKLDPSRKGDHIDRIFRFAWNGKKWDLTDERREADEARHEKEREAEFLANRARLEAQAKERERKEAFDNFVNGFAQKHKDFAASGPHPGFLALYLAASILLTVWAWRALPKINKATWEAGPSGRSMGYAYGEGIAGGTAATVHNAASAAAEHMTPGAWVVLISLGLGAFGFFAGGLGIPTALAIYHPVDPLSRAMLLVCAITWCLLAMRSVALGLKLVRLAIGFAILGAICWGLWWIASKVLGYIFGW